MEIKTPLLIEEKLTSIYCLLNSGLYFILLESVIKSY